MPVDLILRSPVEDVIFCLFADDKLAHLLLRRGNVPLRFETLESPYEFVVGTVEEFGDFPGVFPLGLIEGVQVSKQDLIHL